MTTDSAVLARWMSPSSNGTHDSPEQKLTINNLPAVPFGPLVPIRPTSERPSLPPNFGTLRGGSRIDCAPAHNWPLRDPRASLPPRAPRPAAGPAASSAATSWRARRPHRRASWRSERSGAPPARTPRRPGSGTAPRSPARASAEPHNVRAVLATALGHIWGGQLFRGPREGGVGKMGTEATRGITQTSANIGLTELCFGRTRLQSRHPCTPLGFQDITEAPGSWDLRAREGPGAPQRAPSRRDMATRSPKSAQSDPVLQRGGPQLGASFGVAEPNLEPAGPSHAPGLKRRLRQLKW